MPAWPGPDYGDDTMTTHHSGLTISQEMLGVARRAAESWPHAPSIRPFIDSLWDVRGGFRGRGAAGDLYYTVFAILTLKALGSPLPQQPLRDFLWAQAARPALDFIELCCLGRCFAFLDSPEATAALIWPKLEQFRCPDGGYNPTPNSAYGSAYGCFLALGAHQDIASVGATGGSTDSPVPAPTTDNLASLAHCLQGLQTPDGGYSNERDPLIASTPATAAAAIVLRHLGQPLPSEAAQWLLQRHSDDGGFCAFAQIPVSDLLSTAVALHALAGQSMPLDHPAPRCLDFVQGLYHASGAFRGNEFDDCLDSEYTFYGLLALGHLASVKGPGQ